MKKTIRKPIFIVSALIIVAILAGGYVYFNQSNKTVYDYVVAKKGNITQQVNVTGKVKPAEDVDLAFERSGRVSRVYVSVGDKVSAGDKLIELDNADLIAQLAQAEAGIKAQQAKLDELKKGARPEDIRVAESKVSGYETALEKTKEDIVNQLQDAYGKSVDAMKNKSDQMFVVREPGVIAFRLSFYKGDAELRKKVVDGRLDIENSLIKWRLLMNNLTPDSNFNPYLAAAKSSFDLMRSFFENSIQLLDSFVPEVYPDYYPTRATVDGYKSYISAARIQVNTSIISLSAAEEAFKTAESNLLIANSELAFKKANATVEQLMAQEALVEQAEANKGNIAAQIGKTVLRAPINGTVTKEETKVGEIVSANVLIVSLISNSQFEIEVNISESDIAKLKIGNLAKVTLDAYGNDVAFTAKVVSIEPAENIIEGVATYKTILQFVEKSESVRSGMTANIDIITDKREGVIIIPQRAIITNAAGDKTAKVLIGNEVSDVKIKTGLRGDSGVEIIEGLNEGDKVVLSSE
jgi:RND family efflux transporter MFP subunit